MGRLLVSSPTVRRDPAKMHADDRPPEPLVEGASMNIDPSPPPREITSIVAVSTPHGAAESRLLVDAVAGRENRDLGERQHAKANSTRRTTVRQLRRQRQVAQLDLQVDAESFVRIVGPSRPRRFSARTLYIHGPRAGTLQVTPGSIPQSAIGRSMFAKSSGQSFGPRVPIEAAGRHSRARMPHNATAMQDAFAPLFGSIEVI